MIPTFIGAIVALIGILLLIRGSILSMFALVAVCSIMSGSAALLLPMLGGSSVPPVQFALVFLVLRLFIGEVRMDLVWNAVARNVPLLCFVAYGVLIAVIGPRLFHDYIYVFPMRLPGGPSGYRAEPVAFSPQNVTSLVYLLGLLLLSICASVTMMHQGGARRLVSVGVGIALLQTFLGVSGSVLSNTPWSEALDMMRNGSYAQLDQSFQGLSRIKGIAPEPSAFAYGCFSWFVFMFECWLRDVMPKRTGPAALAVGLTLVFSTSSTAYLGLGVYVAMFVGRAVLIPRMVSSRKMATLVGMAGVACLGCLILASALPAFAHLFMDMFNTMTVGKASSGSGIERAMLAKQGISDLFASYGIGIGPGSFRSSSLVTSILGSTGVFGTAMFVLHVLRVFKPLRPSTYIAVDDGETAVGVAASWAALAVLIPAAAIIPGCDPGPEFAMLGGAALALRWKSFVPLRRDDRRETSHGHEAPEFVAA